VVSYLRACAEHQTELVRPGAYYNDLGDGINTSPRVRGARAQETIELPLPPHPFDSSLIVCYSPRGWEPGHNKSETS